MSVTRRRMLSGAVALTASAVYGRSIVGRELHPSLSSARALAAPTTDVLVLHDGGAAAAAFVETWRASARDGRVVDCAILLSTLEDFNEVGARLDAACCGTLATWLNDADTLVLEALLKMRGMLPATRGRDGRYVTLTAGFLR